MTPEDAPHFPEEVLGVKSSPANKDALNAKNALDFGEGYWNSKTYVR